MVLSQVERVGMLRPAAAAFVGDGCGAPAVVGGVGETKGGEGGAVRLGSVMVERGEMAEQEEKSKWMCVR